MWLILYLMYIPHTGDSAGGNLAAAVSLKLRDMNIQPQPKLQVLIYPVTQMVDFMLPSYVRNEYDPFLNKRLMVALWLLYAQGKFFLVSNPGMCNMRPPYYLTFYIMHLSTFAIKFLFILTFRYVR